MRGQSWYIALLIGLMCLIRFSLSIVGYIDPVWLMTQFHLPIDSNIQMPYMIRVWAIRDIILAIIVAIADRHTVRTLLLACMAIDATDILSAYLSGVAGLFDPSETRSLQLTAVFALILETMALLLSIDRRPVERIAANKN